MGYEIAVRSRIRPSPYFEAAMKAGVAELTVYNRTYLPAGYGDPEAEYWTLIDGVQIWDVAAQRQVEIAGPDAGKLVRYLTGRNLQKCRVGQGKYVPLCTHGGILINDPILLKHSEEQYWLSIADGDILLWVQAIAAERGFDVVVRDPEVAPLAIQGPKSVEVARRLFGDEILSLRHFWFRQAQLDDIEVVVARSGWSKQGGFELYLLDPARGGELWQRVIEAGLPFGIRPGAPNPVERIESGLLSIGTDTDAQSDPFEAGLGDLIDLGREDDFVGKTALARIAATGPRRRRVGLLIDGPPLAPLWRHVDLHYGGQVVGKATAVAYSPRLRCNVAMAIIRADLAEVGRNRALTLEGCEANVGVAPFPLI